ncbi:hypothetical protein ACP70R_014891 [Stipagrostis hirtigluma subsp. patula]
MGTPILAEVGWSRKFVQACGVVVQVLFGSASLEVILCEK